MKFQLLHPTFHFYLLYIHIKTAFVCTVGVFLLLNATINVPVDCDEIERTSVRYWGWVHGSFSFYSKLDRKNCFPVIIYEQDVPSVFLYPAENHLLLSSLQRKNVIDLWYFQWETMPILINVYSNKYVHDFSLASWPYSPASIICNCLKDCAECLCADRKRFLVCASFETPLDCFGKC